MKLNTRFLLVRLVVFLIFSAFTWLMFEHITHDINQQWGKQFAERQVLFDKFRTLSPLIREIKLARQMAAEPVLVELALHEKDVAVQRRARKVLEDYRVRFRDRSYFVALVASGHYYFNDATEQYTASPYRYKLSPQDRNDQWFYATLKQAKDYQVNVDPDAKLGVEKVWINVLLKEGDRVLGVTGTGVDLTEFLKESVDVNQAGIENFFVDASMAIQLSTNRNLIDYASITKEVSERSKIDALFTVPSDVQRMRETALHLQQHHTESATLWVTYRGAKHLLGMTYLPELDWYDLTLINEKNLPLLNGFEGIAIGFGALFLVAMLILSFFLKRWVLHPISQFKRATEAIQQGDYSVVLPVQVTGEMADLSDSFKHMVEVVQQTRENLEHKVKQRTEDLQRLTELDPLTGLLNRRGVMVRFEQEMARQMRQGGSMGLLLLDLDHFKQVNDTHGHAAGDLALCAAANVLNELRRGYDHAGRWGGEEFLMLLPGCDENDMRQIAERIRIAIAALRIDAGTSSFTFTVSIGAHHSQSLQTLDAMLMQVDKALYAAKAMGRNCVKVAGSERD